jgi:hypothetical protein
MGGFGNTANGFQALLGNTIGNYNTATGSLALFSNTTGDINVATGQQALYHNTTGDGNVAVGASALFNNTSGTDNVANGFSALLNNTGSGNVALGSLAGAALTTGNSNIDIGNNVVGVAGESNTLRIGQSVFTTFIAGISGVNEGGTISAVYINTDGQLGTQPPPSARRFKKEIKPMDQTSEAILALKPVTFEYKSDSTGTPQFGLIAEEVANVNPDLVVRDGEGQIYTVRYDAVNAMLLNEFLKEHRKVEEQNRKIEEQEANIRQLKSTAVKQEASIALQRKDFQATIAQQQKGMEAIAARLEEQESQIQKVSAQLEVKKSAPRTVLNDQ